MIEDQFLNQENLLLFKNIIIDCLFLKDILVNVLVVDVNLDVMIVRNMEVLFGNEIMVDIEVIINEKDNIEFIQDISLMIDNKISFLK